MSTKDRCQCISRSTRRRCKKKAKQDGLCWHHIEWGCKTRVEVNCDHLGGMINQNNSCYFDTALYALLYPSNDYIRIHLLNKDVTSIVFSFRGKKTPITSMPDLFQITVKIQEALNHLKKTIHQRQVNDCENIRQLMKDYQEAYMTYAYPHLDRSKWSQNEWYQVEWLHAQNEPLDVITRLQHIFALPDPITMIFATYGITEAQIEQGEIKLEDLVKITEEIRTSSMTIEVTFDELVENTATGFNLGEKIFQIEPTVLDEGNYLRGPHGRLFPGKGASFQVTEAPLIHFHVYRLQPTGERSRSGRKVLTSLTAPVTIKLPQQANLLHLNSIISHLGSSKGGHYVSYIQCKGVWYRYNDIGFQQLEKIGSFEALLNHSQYGNEVTNNSTDYFYM